MGENSISYDVFQNVLVSITKLNIPVLLSGIEFNQINTNNYVLPRISETLMLLTNLKRLTLSCIDKYI